MKRNCTIEQAGQAIGRHQLVRSGDVSLCSCGSWFNSIAKFNEHQRQAVEKELSTYKPRRRAITTELLQSIADTYNAAPARGRGPAVAELLGCTPQSATYYVTLARRAGLL